jgi:thiosulfate/3-mercaptopyruvate sulfurtransferase
MTFVVAAVMAVSLAVSSPPAAQGPGASPRDALLVTPAWLSAHLHDANLVVLEVAGMNAQEAYDAGHIPGARVLNYDAVHAVPKDDAAMAARLQAFESAGISDNSRVVLYSSDDYFAPATRTLLVMNYLGLQHVQLLDGGLKGWTTAGGTLSKEAPLARKGTLSPLTRQPALIADADFVKAHQGAAGFAIVDARNREFYTGEKEGGPRDHRVNGHIPGALNAPFSDFATAESGLKSPSEIAAVFQKAGVKPGDTIVGYCHVGEQATAMLFAARTIGYHVVLYDGSFADWVQHNLPVDGPKQSAPKPSAGGGVHNGSSRDSLVVSSATLAQHLHDSDLVILQVGQRETYDKGHIPGARFLDWMDFHTMADKPGELTLEMPPAQALHDALEKVGVSDNSHVVIYASDGFWSPSTRIFLTFDYAGLSNVRYLDGGLKGWIDAGNPVSKDEPLPKKGTLAPLTLRPIIVDATFVQAHEHAPGFTIVDARNHEFYDGTQGGGQRGQTKKFGHIPGAVNAPYDQFATDDGKLKPAAEIQALFDKAGVKPGDTIVGYCHIGQQATAMLFAARTLGHDVVLYDGSFEDWNARGLPLENPKK